MKKLFLLSIIFFTLSAANHLVYADFTPINIIESPFPEFNAQFGYQIDSNPEQVLIAEYSKNAYFYDGELQPLPVPFEDKLFESTVDLNHEYMAIGYVSTHYDGLDGAGIVYLFNNDGEYLGTIYPPEPITSGHFGASVYLAEDSLYIGEVWADHIELDEGKVHRYKYYGDYLDSLLAPESNYAANYGARLEGNMNWLVVSELNGVHGMLNNGEVHLYSWAGELEYTLRPLDPTVLNDFGSSLALNNEIIVIGESIATVYEFKRAGRIYIYTMNGTLIKTLESPEPIDGGLYGFSVAINDEYLAVGEPRANGLNPIEGAVHIYSLEGEYIETIYSSIEESNSEFGKSLTFNKGSLYVGQPGATVNLLINAGRVIEYSPEPQPPERSSPVLVTGMVVVLLATVGLFIYKMRQDNLS